MTRIIRNYAYWKFLRSPSSLDYQQGPQCSIFSHLLIHSVSQHIGTFQATVVGKTVIVLPP